MLARGTADRAGVRGVRGGRKFGPATHCHTSPCVDTQDYRLYHSPQALRHKDVSVCRAPPHRVRAITQRRVCMAAKKKTAKKTTRKSAAPKKKTAAKKGARKTARKSSR